MVAEKWRTLGISKTAILKVNSEAGEQCSAGALEVFPNMKVISIEYGEDLKSHVLKLKREQVEAIFSPGLPGDAVNLVKQLHALQYNPKIGGGADVLVSEVKDVAAGLQISGFGFKTLPDTFTAKLKGLKPGWTEFGVEGAGLGYLHTKQLAMAIGGCQVRDLKCQVSKMEQSTPEQEIGFKRFDGRVANFETEVR